MQEVLDLTNIVENVISSYEFKIQSMQTIFNYSHLIYDRLNKDFYYIENENKGISTELRDILAKNENLRKKDFDLMVKSVFASQQEDYKNIEKRVNIYLNEQKELANTLKDNFAKIKDALNRGEVNLVGELQVCIKKKIEEQERLKEEIIHSLTQFQKQEQEMVEKFKELIKKGKNLKISDFKSVLKNIETHLNKEELKCN